MQWNFLFFFNSILLGAGLAMDAFSVSLANGLNEPGMKAGRMSLIAGVYAVFQFAMPMLGWLCIHTLVSLFNSLEKIVPWVALALLVWIGGEMIISGMKNRNSFEDEEQQPGLSFGKLLVQGIATSIDALSVGLTIEQYPVQMALAASLIIGAVTFGICFGGLEIGKRVGTRISGKASVAGGLILIAIGLEIFIKGII